MTKDEVQHGRMIFYEAVNDVFIYGAIPEAGIQVNIRLLSVSRFYPAIDVADALFIDGNIIIW